jgi:hypothetical protein
MPNDKKQEVAVVHPDCAANLEHPATSTRDANGRFLSGNIGGGRPKGSRNKLSDVLLSVVVDDFIEHGAEALAQLRQKDPATYLRLVASLVPRELILQREEAPVVDYAELSEAEVVRLLEEQQRRKFIENALDAVPPHHSGFVR